MIPIWQIFLNNMKELKIKWKILKNRLVAILASLHFFGNPSAKLKIVGVTGTNGKTTIATLLYQVFTALGYKCGLIGTAGNIIINETREAKNTTPGAIELNKLLEEMVEKGCTHVFMEVSSHAMDQGRVAGIKFVGGIFTNLTQDHLDYHKNFENYFCAKKKFFKMLPREAFAVSNIDDTYGARMLEGIKAKKYTYGFKNKSDFSEKLNTSLIGDFNAYNALAVYAMATLLGEDSGKVKEILKTVKPPKGRFDYVKSESGVIGIVDYAHTPDALENVLKTVVRMREGGQKIISVFGCGGDRDPVKRAIMGRLGAELSDIAIFTSDNPRTEDPNKIIDQMQMGVTGELKGKVKIIPDRREAIKEAVSLAKSGDYILLAGKGHETYQEIKGVKHHFDDTEELQKAFIEAK